MSRILILIAGHLCSAPRPTKEAETLSAAGHEVTVKGLWFDGELAKRDRQLIASRRWGFDPVLDLRGISLGSRAKCINLRTRRRLAQETCGRLGRFTPSLLGYGPNEMLKAALSESADLTIVHSEAGLWVGAQLLKKGMRVGVDFEDWFSEDFLPKDRIRRPITQLRIYQADVIGQSDYRVTTSHALADELCRAYAAPLPNVVYNVFPFAERARIDDEMRDCSDRRLPSLHC